MKWGIIVLVILGIAAAACAAILVGTLRTDSSADEDLSQQGVEVAMAKISMPAMTVITLDHVIKETVSKDDLPEGRLSKPARVIGRVLSVPVVEGQILTNSCFITEGTGAQLAAALPHGMRAVTINLARGTIPDDILLYPGCVVDVLVSFRLSSADSSKGQAISTTMLRGIQVLVVAGESVVSNPDEEAKDSVIARRTSRGTTVTLLVDPKQAEALQLATTNGSVSLTIRNPLDKRPVDMEATILSQGRLARLGTALTPVVLAAAQKEQGPSAEQTQEDSATDTDIMGQQFISDEKEKIRQYPRWDITVIRGRETTVEELDIHQDEPDATATAIK
jgi:Flp pilus assembly protein CpaB